MWGIQPKSLDFQTKTFFRIYTAKAWLYFFIKQSSGFIQQKLDYIFILNSLQEYSKGAGILTALSTQYSPVFFSAFNGKCKIYGHGLWKLNSSLFCDTKYNLRIKSLMLSFKSTTKTNNSQLDWELLKYKI